MSTYVLMRILESAPRRYDLGIRLLTLGRAARSCDRLAEYIEPGQRVLDVGCGTGAMTLRAARRGALVKGIDVNAQMLEIAERRARRMGLAESVNLVEAGVAELDAEDSESYEVVISTLCFSELGADELAWALMHSARVLKPGGLLLVADEVEPRNRVGRWAYRLLRAPLGVLTYLITQQTTHAVVGLPERLGRAGFSVVSARSGVFGSFLEIVALKPTGGSV